MQTKDQLDQNMLTSILSNCKGELVQNGRISLDKLYDLLKSQ
jgi:hypothetical protein